MIRKFIFLFGFFLILAQQCMAGIRAEIGDPDVLPSVKHKIVVLEFQTPHDEQWGYQISQVLAHETLGSMRGINGVGVINLEQPEQKLSLDAQKVIEIAQQQKALVAIWGEFYEQKGTVFVHAHLRIIPTENFPESALGLSLTVRPVGKMLSQPPTLQINFAPIAVSVSSLSQLDVYYQKGVHLRSRPQFAAPVIGELGRREMFYIKEVQGDWAKIQMENGPAGWIRYATLGVQKELVDLRGVVLFAQAALLYIGGNYKASEDSFERYIQEYGQNQDPMNQALAYILLGNAKFRAKESDVSYAYEKASQLLPNRSSPVEYIAIYTLSKAIGEGLYDPMIRRQILPEMQQIERRLISAVQEDPNSRLIQNMQNFYQIARQFELLKGDLMTDSEYNSAIRSRLSLLDEIELSIRKEESTLDKN